LTRHQFLNNYSWAETGFTVFGGITQRPDDEFWPDNGTQFWRVAVYYGPAILTSDTGGPFDVVSIDLAEYSAVVNPNRDIEMTGVLQNGSTVTFIHSLDAVIDGSGPDPDFETVVLPETFRGLTEFRIENDIVSLDNILVVPAAPTALVLIGALLPIKRRRFR